MSEKKTPPLESVLTKNIMNALKAEGVTFLFKSFGNGYQRMGLPDILLLVPNGPCAGRLVGLEVKRPAPYGTKVSAMQQRNIDLMNQSGGYACIVRSVEEALIAVNKASKGEQP